MFLTKKQLLLLSFLIVSFFSCQNEEESSPTGTASFRLSVQDENIVNIGRIQSVSTDDFVIAIIDKSNDQEVASYPRFADMPSSISLVQGEYKVTASSGTETAADFDNPVYYGESDLSITAGETSTVSIECVLSNIKVQITHTEDAMTRFSDVYTEVSTENGTLTFTQGESRFGYFSADGDLTTLTVNIYYTQGGVETTTTKTYDASTNDYFDIMINASLDGEAGVDVAVGDENVIEDEILIGEFSDRDILMALYNSTDGENWSHNFNWGSDEPLNQWSGISTDNGFVTRIDLSYRNLSGEIPAALGKLTNLRYLNLSNNQLTGGLPSALGDLSNLKEMILYDNQLTGEIPSDLSKLSKLENLELSINQFTSVPTALGNLTNLKVLTLSANPLTEVPTTLGNLTNLERLSMSNSQLTIITVEIGNLTNLKNLVLTGTKITEIPSSIGNLTKLEYLNLENNQLVDIPVEFGSLTNLRSLYMRDNQLTGEIPASLGNLTNLKEMLLFNNKLTGEIPATLGNLTNLEMMDLSNNQLTGQIPSELGNLSSLEYMYLYKNQLTGTIPSALGSLPNLLDLYLYENDLSGEIPSELANITTLEYLYLRSNQLTGPIPQAIVDVILSNGGSFLVDPENVPL
ncbi:leucine-rich repeat domain-containing protein [Flammeovirga aprica]|uniref:DUF4493 domain-containing protein n=1 Tax=Flammeovirga aprica JL-4 TaxID=694437 RepID=A0A7X9RY27_9BACT|nr:leucine-rich repeat domain-containing protein [Flammeovirga aprica]NME70762.1 DUF4493 domain-containing protein [Flammeovirga aprica JL-4]